MGKWPLPSHSTPAGARSLIGRARLGLDGRALPLRTDTSTFFRRGFGRVGTRVAACPYWYTPGQRGPCRIRVYADSLSRTASEYVSLTTKEGEMSSVSPLTRHVSGNAHFGRHLLEMAVAMMVGMMASAAVFFGVTGLAAADAMRQHAVAFVAVQAFGMTVAMVAWMRHRGHAWRGCAEMAGAMVIPAVPLVGLRLADVISGPICGAYCALTFAAMVVVMIYRRRDYGHIAETVNLG